MKKTASATTFLGQLTTGRTRRRYKTDELVFAQGAPADAVFHLVQGSVCVTAVSPRGKRADIGILRRGAFLGEDCLGGRAVRSSTARAREPSTIVRVDREVMASLLRREPDFAGLFTTYLLSRHVRSEQDLIGQFFLSSEKRLAGVLLSMSGMGSTAPPAAVRPRVTDDGLALMLGLTLGHVRELMVGFRRMGFIASDRSGLKVRRGLLGVVLHE